MIKIFRALFFLRWPMLLFFILLSSYGVFHFDQIKIDRSFKSLQVENDPSLKVYEKFKQQFGSDYNAIFFFKDKNLFTSKKLVLLQEFVWDLEEMNFVEGIDSIFSTSNFINKNGILNTSPVIEDIPNTNNKIMKQLKKMIHNPFINHNLINVPMTSIIINIKIKDSFDMTRVYNLLSKRVDKSLINHFDIVKQIGNPALENYTNKEMIRAISILLPILLAFIFIVNFFFTKSIHASVISTFSFLFTILITFSIMIKFNIPVYFLTSIVPVLAYVLNSTEITHMTVEFLSLNKIRLRERVDQLFEEIGGAIILTATSTFVGFFSMIFSDIIMLKNFAIVSSISLLVGFFVSIVVFLVYFSIVRFSEAEGNTEAKDISEKNCETKVSNREKLELTFLVRSIDKFYLKTHLNKAWIILPYLLLIVVFLSFRNIETENSSLELMTDKSELKSSFRAVNNDFQGLSTFYVSLHSDNDLRNPKILKKLLMLQEDIRKIDGVTRVDSFAKVISLIHKEMNSLSIFTIPDNKSSIYQYLLSVSSDDIKNFISPNFKDGSLNIYHGYTKSKDQKVLVKNVNKLFEKYQADFRLKLTGQNILNLHAMDKIVDTMFFSFILTLFTIFILISFFFKSFIMGVISIPPNIIPLLILVAAMGILGVSLNIGTAIVCSITLGIAVDDTIHLFYRFSKESSDTSNPHQAALQTINKEQVPIIATSISLAGGFLIMAYSDFLPFVHFGVFAALLLIGAMISDLYFTPFLIGAIGAHKFSMINNPIYFMMNNLDNLDSSDLTKTDLRNICKYGKIRTLYPGTYMEKDFISSEYLLLLDGSLELEKKGQRDNEKQYDNNYITLDHIPVMRLYKISKVNSQLFLKSDQKIRVVEISKFSLRSLKNKHTSTYYALYDIIYESSFSV